MRRILCLWSALCISMSCLAADSLQIMFYNLYRFPSATPNNRSIVLGDILSSFQPDILLTCELENEQGMVDILQNSFSYTNDSFAAANFVYNQSDTSELLQQMVFYNTKKLILHKQVIYLTTVRDINHYTFYIPTTNTVTDTLFLEVFVAHLKSSTGPANRQARYDMVDTFVQVLNTLPVDRAVLFAGDFNFYNANEIGYQHIIDTNRLLKMIDPIQQPGSWQDNAAFAAIHTQATRTSAAGFGLYGATGGLDDRFDFIMMSENLNDTASKFHYVPNSYQAYGNNGNCLNQKVNDTACNGPFQQFLREQLHNMSDHLPVVMQLKINDSIIYDTPIDTTNISIINRNNNAFMVLQNYAVGENLLLKFNKPIMQQTEAIIYNAVGLPIATFLLKEKQDNYVFAIPTLPAGIYFVHIKGFNKSQRFIKQ